MTEGQAPPLMATAWRCTYSKEPGSAAELAAKAVLESRGNTPRLYRNTLVFLAADKVRLQDLDEAVRRFLAWESILEEKVALNLDPHQVRQAETQKGAADGAATARLPEAYQWLLVPEQSNPQAPVTWAAVRLSGGDALAVRASKKLRSDESLVTSLGSTILRKHLDDVPLWPDGHVAIKQLVEHFARYHYLPRLAGPEVLMHAIRDGLGLITWQTDAFAYAESYDPTAGRYRGLRSGQVIPVVPDNPGLLVKPDLARRQMDAEAAEVVVPPKPPQDGQEPDETDKRKPPVAEQPKVRRFHGRVALDPVRAGAGAGKITEEVISHLTSLMHADVRVTLEIEAHLPDGATEQVVRTVTENCRTLKFESQGFEKE